VVEADGLYKLRIIPHTKGENQKDLIPSPEYKVIIGGRDAFWMLK